MANVAIINVDVETDKIVQNNPVNPIQPEWVNPPTIKNLKQDYTDARSDHDNHVADVDRWLDNLNVKGKAQPKKINGRSSIQPKLIRKQAEWRYSSLSEPFLSNDNLFNTTPVTFEDKQAAVQNGLVLNNQFNTKIEKVRFINDYIRTAVDEGTVICRVGWNFQEEEQMVEVEVPVFAETVDDNVLALNGMVQQGQMSPEEAHQMMQSGQPVQLGTRIEMQPQMVTIKNEPTIDVCNYRNVIIDPTCQGDITKAAFVIYLFDTSLSDLKKDGKYTNLDKINVEDSSVLAEPDYDSDTETSFEFSDEPRKKIVAYEYWGYWDIDGTGETKPFVSTWVGNTMIRLEESPFPDSNLPFTTAQYLPQRRSIFGEPDGELLEDNQKIIGAVTRGMIDIMGRSANGQMGTRKDALDVTNKRKFDRGLDYEYNSQVDPRLAFHMHTYPEIPQSAGLMLQLQNNEAESLTGVKAFSSGIGSKSLGDVAEGIRSAMDATSKRELDILRRMAEGIKQIGRKFIAMNAVFLEEEEVVRITNEEFVPVRRDDLQGNIDLVLTISTPEADNEKAKELAFMLQTTGQTMGAAFSQIILSEIATLRKMPALAKEIKEYKPEPDPVAEKMKELEVAKLEAEIAKLRSEAQENMTDSALNQAKAQSEVADAAKTTSEKDAIDLDFVETETGTKHQRDVDVVQSQAEANTKMKIMDNLTKPKKETSN